MLTCLQVLRYLYFQRRILHRDISAGNVMYIEEPSVPAQGTAANGSPLHFAKYLLEERCVSRR